VTLYVENMTIAIARWQISGCVMQIVMILVGLMNLEWRRRAREVSKQPS
jgi:hypothetical protein